MAVKLRLKRFGRLNHPTYRVCAAEARFPRDGRVIETLGFYLPKHTRVDEQFKLDAERVAYWLSVGAIPSETVGSLIKRAGIEMPQRASKSSKTNKRPQRKVENKPPKKLGKGRMAKAKWRAKHGEAKAAPAAAAPSEDAS